MPKKLTIEDVQKKSLSLGWLLISTKYAGNNMPMKFKCPVGHITKKRYGDIQSGVGCATCRNMHRGDLNRHTIDDVRKTAKTLNWKVLSNIYTSAKSLMTFKCDRGHKIKVRYGDILKGHRCPICWNIRRGNTQRLSLERIKKEVAKIGWKVLSNEYINSRKMMLFECDKGHTIKKNYNDVRSGRGCIICYNNRRGSSLRLTIDDVRKTAGKIGWEVVSTKYINSRTPITFKCDSGHIITKSYSDLQAGYGCPTCYDSHRGDSRRLTIEDVAKSTEILGWHLLSTSYINNHTEMDFECPCGHKIKTTFNRLVQSRGGCVACHKKIGESICRKIFELLFNKPFSTARPQWLRINKTVLELDGYCKELRVAFEYQGQQHYRENKRFFHKHTSLNQIEKHDAAKIELCEKNGILLIDVPYWISYSAMPCYVIKRLKNSGIEINNIPLEVFDAINYVDLNQRYNNLKKMADDHNCELLSNTYIGSKSKYCAKCRCGNTFYKAYDSLMSGRWCPKCRTRRYTLNDARVLYKLRGMTLLASSYKSTKIPMPAICDSCGYALTEKLESVIRGHGCPQCN